MSPRSTPGPPSRPASPSATADNPAVGSQLVPHPAAPRRWPHRVLIALNITVATGLVAAGAGYGYFRLQFGRLRRQPFEHGVLRTDAPGKVMNVLLVGSDSRAALDPAEQQFGSSSLVAGQRSDVIMILHADPAEKKAAILSLPRDLYVPIAGTTRTDRINSAFDKGPAALIQTIDHDLGIPIDHYVEVNFDGFKGIVDAVGGIDVYFPAPARDVYSNLDIKQAGCVHLNGAGALSYVRSRHYQYYEAGRWHADPTSDFGRIQRQQDFIRRVLRKLKGVRDPLTLNQVITTGVHQVTIDNALSASDIFRLANRFSSLSPDTVDMLTVPTTPFTTTIGGYRSDVLKLKQPDAQLIIDRFTGKTPPATAGTAVLPDIPPSSVRVRVLNGAGTAGLASRAAAELRDAGFAVAGAGDAEAFTYTTTVITYGPGQQAKAQLLAASITGPTEIRPDPTLRAIDAVVTLGATFTGAHTPAASPAAASTTTTSTAAQAPVQASGKPATVSC